jgi:hypothetical protein
MKFKNEQGLWVPYRGMPEQQNKELSRLITECLERKPSVLICVIGNKGSGKSLLGKYFRRHGIGEHPPHKIAVIDDDNMAVDFLYFFRRWHKIRCQGIDELKPFEPFFKNKPIRLYLKSNPESRITKADIVVRLIIEESLRHQRLLRRYGKVKGDQVYGRSLLYEESPKIYFESLLEFRTDQRLPVFSTT